MFSCIFEGVRWDRVSLYTRKERIIEPGIYHILNRGVERRNVFNEDSDYDFF